VRLAPSSIRGRLIAGTVAAVAVAFVVVGVVVLVLTRSSLRTQFDDGLADKARELAAQIEEDDGKVSSEIDPRTIAATEAFEIWAEGHVLAKSSSLGARDLVPERDEHVITSVQLGSHPARQITLHVQPRREPEDHGAADDDSRVVLAFARSTEAVDATVDRVAAVLVGVGLAGILLCVVLLFGVVRFGLSPVRSLAQAIAAIREDDLSARLAAATTAAELAPVAERLDELLGRLAAAFARERELTAEIAHELRTPLSGLRATLEVALDRERPADRYRTALVECLAITRQTEGVVESLLSLARLDAGQVVIAATPIDLDQLVRDVLATVHTRATERHLEITTDLPPITRTLDRDKVRVIITNLVDNAVTYAEEGGHVRVELAGDVVRISNTGCTLDRDQIAHVFERFWRADASRTASGHVGLGLALCKKLADLLGATITAEVTGGRFIATLTLPS